MGKQTDHRNRVVSLIRWTARIWAVASVTLLLAFIIGEGTHSNKTSELLRFALFPCGSALGMVLSLRKESIGGGITVGCLLAYYILNLATTGPPSKVWAWLLFAAPGFLFLTLRFLSQGENNSVCKNRQPS